MVEYRDRGFRRIGQLRWLERIVLVLGILLMVIVFAIMLWKTWPYLIDLFSFATPAYAGDNPGLGLSTHYKLIINFGIALFILIAGGVTGFIMLFGDDAAQVQSAGDYFKMIFGFLLGAAKSFLEV